MLVTTAIGLLMPDAANAAKLKLHTIGDSTMADYQETTTRTRGWGEMLQEFFSPEVEVVNYARGGRSSRSFYDEGLWQKVKDNMQKGDYVLIQFAHNDEKEGGKDGADGRGTEPWTTYRRHLEMYVDETRQLGGIPVFVSPTIRRYFKDGKITRKGCHDIGPADNDSILNYVRVMKTVARERGVELVDMTELTRQFAESLGEGATTRQIYVPTDGTHTQATGAACYAQLAAAEMKRMGILADYINPSPAMVLNPLRLDFGTTFVGDCQQQVFDVTGLHLAKQEGVVKLTAPEGMTLSATPDGKPQPSIEVPYTDGRLWCASFYLYYAPQGDGEIEAPVTITDNGTDRTVMVHAIGRRPTKTTDVTLTKYKQSCKGLKEKDGQIGTEKGEPWPDDIDESASRYVEYVLKAGSKTTMIKQMTFELRGDVCYRVAVARGKDFFPRTDIGELQRNGEATRTVTMPVNMTLAPGAQLNVRFFPWVVGGGSKTFSIVGLKFEATEVE